MDQEAHPINEDGDVFIVNIPAGEKCFLKILFSDGGADYLKDENVYHTVSQLNCEMEILAGLSTSPLGTAQPVRDLRGDFVSRLGDVDGAAVYATLTTLIGGILMEECRQDPVEMAFAAGVAAAHLHQASQQGLAAIAVHRPHRRQEYLGRVMERIREHVRQSGTITSAQFAVLQQGAGWLLDCMRELDQSVSRQVGLVHTDLRAGNFMMSAGRAIPVDFTRSVYGYHLYDLGEMCAHMGGMAPDNEAQRQILLGYHSIRPFRVGQVLKVQGFFVMFLLILLAENGGQAGSPWLADTVEKMCGVYIPGLLTGGHFALPVRQAIEESQG